MKRAIIYIHGKGGSAKEAEAYSKSCPGFDIIGVDYNEYLPWIVQPEIKACYDEICKEYDSVFLIANSIGTYFSMLALQNCKIEKALFISPILNMEKLILDMISWAGISEKKLEERGEIQTDFGETLFWQYLCFARKNPISWNIQTEILYAGKDNLITRETVDDFVCNHNAELTVMENGEHWFHTEEQVRFLDAWMKRVIT